jgi:phosphopentomutase
MKYKRVFLFVLDGCGCGEQPDYKRYHAVRSNTLGSLYRRKAHFVLPTLEALGLSQLLGLKRDGKRAIYGKLCEVSKGNDTFAGVWEMIGQPFLKRFSSNRKGFSDEMLTRLERALGTKTVGNEYISGYKALDKYYAEHVRTRGPIVYFSDDGVILFAGHKNIIKPTLLNRYAKKFAQQLTGSNYARIITRPFTGKPKRFVRLERYRKDFIVNASTPRLLQSLVAKKIPVRITEHLYHLFGSPTGVSVLNNDTKEPLSTSVDRDFNKYERGFFMYVFQDTDNFGHKKDATGFREALHRFDVWLSDFLKKLRKTDIVIITADHGCNPALKNVRGHNREYVPLFVFSPSIERGMKLGIRKSFADVGATIAYNFKTGPTKVGQVIHEIV